MEKSPPPFSNQGWELLVDYKAVRLQGIYYGTFFQSNLSLSDWVNSQRLLVPLFVWAMVMGWSMESV